MSKRRLLEKRRKRKEKEIFSSFFVTIKEERMMKYERLTFRNTF
jgi:hypothetical protein